jgi:hypothetical protein
MWKNRFISPPTTITPLVSNKASGGDTEIEIARGSIIDSEIARLVNPPLSPKTKLAYVMGTRRKTRSIACLVRPKDEKRDDDSVDSSCCG